MIISVQGVDELSMKFQHGPSLTMKKNSKYWKELKMKQITNEEHLRVLSEFKGIQEDMLDIYYNHELTNDMRLAEIMKLVRELGRKLGND